MVKTRKGIMPGKKPVLAAGLLLVAALGCNSKTKPTPANFQAALNAHFTERNECLFPTMLHFPYEVGSTAASRKEAQQMEALMKSGLLTRQEDLTIHVNRYSLTPAGQRATARFCYGHRHITGIDSSTPPVKKDGFPETQVTYKYVLEDVPVWARTPQVIQAFPQLKEQLSGDATDKATLAQTLAGWQVPE